MANTKTNTQTFCGKTQVVQYLTLAYVDTATEADYLIYDSSAVATTLGLTDTLNCNINSIYATVSAASTARVWLEFDATTDVVAMDLPVGMLTKNDFRPIGGLRNTSGTGKTGDIFLNATGLSTGDIITVVLNVDPR